MSRGKTNWSINKLSNLEDWFGGRIAVKEGVGKRRIPRILDRYNSKAWPSQSRLACLDMLGYTLSEVKMSGNRSIGRASQGQCMPLAPKE